MPHAGIPEELSRRSAAGAAVVEGADVEGVDVDDSVEAIADDGRDEWGAGCVLVPAVSVRCDGAECDGRVGNVVRTGAGRGRGAVRVAGRVAGVGRVRAGPGAAAVARVEDGREDGVLEGRVLDDPVLDDGAGSSRPHSAAYVVDGGGGASLPPST